MPISETPTSTPLEQPETGAGAEPGHASPEGLDASPEDLSSPSSSNGSRLLPTFRRNRYQGLDHTDLLHVIEEIEDSRSWVGLREKLWIALIVHMLIAWYLFYGPKYIYHVRVVDPSTMLKQRQKDLTYLDLPPDALKNIKPKPNNVISDRNRVAESPHPNLDRKTLQELEAMRRAAPPKAVQAPPAPQQQASSAPPQPQVAQQRAPSPPAQPLPENNQAKLEAPPTAPRPSFTTGSGNPNEQLQQAMRQAMRSGAGQYGGGGDDGLNAPSQHPGAQGAVDVLSDTMGIDFGPYIQRVIWDTKRAWYPIIPESARPPLNKEGRVMIRFRIYPDGSVHNMVLEGPSGDVALDRAAWAGITGASPYPPLPGPFKGPFLELRFYFLYNIQPGDQ